MSLQAEQSNPQKVALLPIYKLSLWLYRDSFALLAETFDAKNTLNFKLFTSFKTKGTTF